MVTTFITNNRDPLIGILLIFIWWKIISYIRNKMIRASLGQPLKPTPKPITTHSEAKAEKPRSEYMVRIDKLLENAKDEKEAVKSLKVKIEQLYQRRDELTGYAQAEITTQLAKIGKYIAMFEEVQNERKRTELNSHAKHVLDKVWD